MVNSSILNPLSKKGLFASEIEQALSAYFVKMNFKAGYILWNEGETAERMLSIISGKVKIFRPLAGGKTAAIYIFGPGDTFGFMPLIDGSSYPAIKQKNHTSGGLKSSGPKAWPRIFA